MSTARRLPSVAVVGSAQCASGDIRLALAEELGARVIDEGYMLVTGGLGGVMEAACRGARSSSSWSQGRIVGILPGHDPDKANPWVDVAVPTGLDLSRNVVVAHADALVAIGGGAGTLAEMALGWQLHRLLIGMRTEGWSGRLADTRIDHRTRYPGIPDDRVWGVDTVEDAIGALRRLLPQYDRRHKGIP